MPTFDLRTANPRQLDFYAEIVERKLLAERPGLSRHQAYRLAVTEVARIIGRPGSAAWAAAPREA